MARLRNYTMGRVSGGGGGGGGALIKSCSCTVNKLNEVLV